MYKRLWPTLILNAYINLGIIPSFLELWLGKALKPFAGCGWNLIHLDSTKVVSLPTLRPDSTFQFHQHILTTWMHLRMMINTLLVRQTSLNISVFFYNLLLFWILVLVKLKQLNFRHGQERNLTESKLIFGQSNDGKIRDFWRKIRLRRRVIATKQRFISFQTAF